MAETGAEEIWVTHGREEALVYHASQHGIKAQALSLRLRGGRRRITRRSAP